MSTRKIIRERKKYFEFVLKKEPNNKNYKEALNELVFISEKLKEHDRQ